MRRTFGLLFYTSLSLAMALGQMTSAPYRKTQISGPSVFKDKVMAAHSAVFVRSWESLMGLDDKLSGLHSAPYKPQSWRITVLIFLRVRKGRVFLTEELFYREGCDDCGFMVPRPLYS